MTEEVVIHDNIPDFRDALKALDAKLQRKIVSGAVAAASKVIKAAVIAEAPVFTPGRGKSTRAVPGLLRRAVYVYRIRDQQPGSVKAVVSFRKRKKTDAYYGAFLQRGFSPRGPGKKIRGSALSRHLQRKHARSQNLVINDFMTRGFQQSREAALQAFIVAMQAGLNENPRAP